MTSSGGSFNHERDGKLPGGGNAMEEREKVINLLQKLHKDLQGGLRLGWVFSEGWKLMAKE